MQTLDVIFTLYIESNLTFKKFCETMNYNYHNLRRQMNRADYDLVKKKKRNLESTYQKLKRGLL